MSVNGSVGGSILQIYKPLNKSYNQPTQTKKVEGRSLDVSLDAPFSHQQKDEKQCFLHSKYIGGVANALQKFPFYPRDFLKESVSNRHQHSQEMSLSQETALESRKINQ